MLGAAKDQCQFITVLVQQFDQQVGLSGLGHKVHRLVDFLDRLAGWVCLDAHRISQVRAC